MSAQVNEQRIFLWDVSHSLIKNQLEQHLKDALISSIEVIEENGTDRIVLVPFYNKPLQVIEVEASASGKRALINEINSRSIKGSAVSNTNIVSAINKFHELIKPGYRNYMFLYTDGQNENERQQNDMEPLVRLLEQWGIRTKDKNAYGFYVLVDKAADFKELRDIERDNDNFFIVKDANVRIKILNLPQTSIFNSKNENLLKVPVSGDLTHINKNITIKCEDTIYTIDYKDLKIGKDGKIIESDFSVGHYSTRELKAFIDRF